MGIKDIGKKAADTVLRRKPATIYEQIEKIRDVRSLQKFKRDTDIEDKIISEEKKALKKVKDLLGEDLAAMADEVERIKHLISIIVEMQKIRDFGQQAVAKKKFADQLAALIQTLDRTNQFETQLRDVIRLLGLLNKENQKHRKTIAAEIKALNAAAPAPGAVMPPRYNELNDWATELVRIGQQTDMLLESINQISKPVTQAMDFKSLVNRAGEEIRYNQYLEAQKKLHDLLNERQAEDSDLLKVGNMTTRAQDLIDRQREIIDAF